jgi:hypothetical protein
MSQGFKPLAHGCGAGVTLAAVSRKISSLEFFGIYQAFGADSA